jgi:hypothetical protein
MVFENGTTIGGVTMGFTRSAREVAVSSSWVTGHPCGPLNYRHNITSATNAY